MSRVPLSSKKRRTSGYDVFVIALALMGGLSLAFAGAAIPMVATIVLLPVGLLMMVLPALATIVVLARLTWIVVPGRWGGLLRGVAALGAAAAVLFAAAQLVNLPQHLRMVALTAADRQLETPLVKGRTLAVLRDAQKTPRDISKCDPFCQLALLSGEASRVIMLESPDLSDPPDPSLKGLAYRFERRATCPDVAVGDAGVAVKVKGDDETVRPDDAVRLRIARGECLIEETARAGEADYVLVAGRIATGTDAYGAGLGPWADTLSAWRHSVWERADAVSGAFRETYRQTGVRAYPVVPVLLPFVNAKGWHSRAGLLRTTTLVNLGRFAHALDWSQFVTADIGFTLQPSGGRLRENVKATIRAAMDRPGPFSAGENAVVSDYFTGYVKPWGRKRPDTIDADEVAFALDVLSDPRTPTPKHVIQSYLFAKDAERVGGGLPERLAKLSFERLKATSDSSEVGFWSRIVGSLPAPAITPYHDSIVGFADDPVFQQYGAAVLARLADAGASSVPQLLELIQTGLEGGDVFFRDNRYQHPYLTGIGGLCRMGADGAAALPQITAWLKERRLPIHASYWDMTITTVIRLGGDPDALWPLFQTRDSNHTRERYDLEVTRARSDRFDCGY